MNYPVHHRAAIMRILNYPGAIMRIIHYSAAIMGPLGHGAMETWSHGAMRPWGHGAMGPWGHGAMEPWGHKARGPWGHEAMSHGPKIEAISEAQKEAKKMITDSRLSFFWPAFVPQKWPPFVCRFRLLRTSATYCITSRPARVIKSRAAAPKVVPCTTRARCSDRSIRGSGCPEPRDGPTNHLNNRLNACDMCKLCTCGRSWQNIQAGSLRRPPEKACAVSLSRSAAPRRIGLSQTRRG